MDSRLALETIKKTEVQAQALIEQAKREAKGIFEEAAAQKARIIKAAQEKALLEAKELKDKVNGEAMREIAGIEAQGEGEIRALREKVQKNFDRAVEFIRKKIETC